MPCLPCRDLSCNACTVPMVGPLSSGLAQLEYLQTLNLAYNELTGPLPVEWGDNNTFLSLVDL